MVIQKDGDRPPALFDARVEPTIMPLAELREERFRIGRRGDDHPLAQQHRLRLPIRPRCPHQCVAAVAMHAIGAPGHVEIAETAGILFRDIVVLHADAGIHFHGLVAIQAQFAPRRRRAAPIPSKPVEFRLARPARHYRPEPTLGAPEHGRPFECLLIAAACQRDGGRGEPPVRHPKAECLSRQRGGIAIRQADLPGPARVIVYHRLVDPQQGALPHTAQPPDRGEWEGCRAHHRVTTGKGEHAVAIGFRDGETVPLRWRAVRREEEFLIGEGLFGEGDDGGEISVDAGFMPVEARHVRGDRRTTRRNSGQVGGEVERVQRGVGIPVRFRTRPGVFIRPPGELRVEDRGGQVVAVWTQVNVGHLDRAGRH